MPMTPAVVLDGLVFPECPRWHDGALYFSDMQDGIVWRLSSEGKATKVVEVPGRPAGLGWLPDGSLQIVSMLDRRLLRLTERGLVTVADLSSFSSHPTNDMVVDRHGRAYIGNAGFTLGGQETPCTTFLLCVEANGDVRIVADEIFFPNGTVITPDGKTLIIGETYGRRLTAFGIEANGGLTNRRVFAPLGELFPDGICLDREGAIWVACPGANSIVRVKQGGEITHTIPLPGRQSYACMLGGADRRDLYICTAHHHLPERRKEPRGGKIEMVRVEVPGAGLP